MKIVLITGGSGGIGASVAQQCAAKGMGVIVTYKRHPEAALRVVKEIEASGGRAVALHLMWLVPKPSALSATPYWT